MHDGCRTLACVSTVLEGPRVREIVAATPLGRADLVAGRAGLDRTVALARLVDVPGLDDARRARSCWRGESGPLVGTAGCLIVERLVGGGAAGLAIARGHYLGTVHRRVRARADEVGLPILTLPVNSRLAEIADAVEAAVLDRRYQALRHADGVQRALSRILLGGGDLAALIERASELLGNPLVLLDDAGRRVAASPDAGFVPRLDDLDLAAGAQEIELGDDRRLLVASVPGASGGGCSLALVPLQPFGPYDETALDHVASLVAVELLRGQQLRLAEDRLRADLVRDALAAREPAEDLAARAHALGSDFAAPQVAVTAGVDDVDAVLDRLGRGGTGAREAVVRLLVAQVEAALGRAALVARDGDSAVALLPADRCDDLRDRLAAAATALAHAEPGLVLAAGWGRAAALGEHGRSLAEARRARALGGALRSGGAHGYEDVAVYDALLGEGAPGAARQLAAHTLGPLTPELRRTLEVHLQGGLSVARTAERAVPASQHRPLSPRADRAADRPPPGRAGGPAGAGDRRRRGPAGPVRLRGWLAVGAALGLALAPTASARPDDGLPGGYGAAAVVCHADVDARVRAWWSDTPGDHDAPAGADGDCATVPPWIGIVGQGATTALDVARSLGFPPPPADAGLGGDGRYDVYVLDLGAREKGLLGLAALDGVGPASSLLVDEAYADELPRGYPTSPEDELRVTVAHELFHAIQFGMGALELPQWILEGTAVWFEAHAQPAIPDNHGYLRRHLTGDRGRLPLWVQGGCGDACWVPGLPRDDVHVYATWLFFWSAGDEQGDPELVRRLLTRLAAAGPRDDFGLAALRATTGGDLPVRLREYGLSLLGRRRIGPNPVPPAVAAGPVREGRVTPAADVRGELWPLQPLYVGVAPVAGPARVVVRTPPVAAALLRRGLALVLADGRVLRLPRQVDDTLVFDLPAASGGGTLVLTSTRAVWPLAYRVELRPVQRPAAGGDGTA